VLILLPPSEGKTAPAAGAPADPGQLWLPRLAPARRRVLSRLVALSRRTSARGVADSLAVLGLSAAQHGEVARNAGLPTAPAAPAAEVYTGVLYEALDPAGLAPDARGRLDEQVVVFSGLWGVLRLTDRIPAYRCSVGVALPVLGGLTAYWRKALGPALDRAAADGPVLDLRSGAYAAMWARHGNAYLTGFFGGDNYDRFTTARFNDPPGPVDLAESLRGGAIFARWESLGGANSLLGAPRSPEGSGASSWRSSG